MRATRMLFALLLAAACTTRHPVLAPPPAPTAASEWPSAYARALTEARETRLASADRVLTEFAQRFPDSPEAAEVPYWRAVYKLDPANSQSTREAASLLEGYLTNAPNGLHRMEAQADRKLIAALDAKTAALAAAQAVVAPPKPDDKAREEEIAQLRDDLAKANAELARIKRRLTRPKP